jgi:hypothetical protein
MQEDPVKYEAGDINLYRFVMNNPVRHLDPTGLQAQGSDWIAVRVKFRILTRTDTSQADLMRANEIWKACCIYFVSFADIRFSKSEIQKALKEDRIMKDYYLPINLDYTIPTADEKKLMSSDMAPGYVYVYYVPKMETRLPSPVNPAKEDVYHSFVLGLTRSGNPPHVEIGNKYFTEVLAHELGHALGLYHTKEKSSLMYEFFADSREDIKSRGTRLTPDECSTARKTAKMLRMGT